MTAKNQADKRISGAAAKSKKEQHIIWRIAAAAISA